MRHSDSAISVVIMGVSGAGKTTIGQSLAVELGAEFRDGDDLHSQENIAAMAAGTPLGDRERTPWLHAVGRSMAEARSGSQDVVMACSALKRSYRDLLRQHVPDLFFVFLDGPMDLVHERIVQRNHNFMPASLLASQYMSLQPLQDDEDGVRIDIGDALDQTVREIMATPELATQRS